jgi:hypothetical protein
MGGRGQDEKKAGSGNCLPKGEFDTRSNVGLGLAQTLYAVACFPLAALSQQFDALETLEDIAFNYEAGRALEAFVLGHGLENRGCELLRGAVVEFAFAHDKYFSPTRSARTTIHSGIS